MTLHAGQATKVRPLAVDRTVRWLPLDDAFYLLAEVMTSTRAAPLVVLQDALLQVESHAALAVGAAACGVLCGGLYRDPRTRVEYLLVEHAERSTSADVDGNPYASLAVELSRTVARVESDGIGVVGWYRFDVPFDQRIPTANAGIHRALFPETWQVALLRNGAPGEGNGAFVRVEPNEGRPYKIPFLELVPRKHSRGRRPKVSSVRWRNYSAESVVAVLPREAFLPEASRDARASPSARPTRPGFLAKLAQLGSPRPRRTESVATTEAIRERLAGLNGDQPHLTPSDDRPEQFTGWYAEPPAAPSSPPPSPPSSAAARATEAGWPTPADSRTRTSHEPPPPAPAAGIASGDAEAPLHAPVDGSVDVERESPSRAPVDGRVEGESGSPPRAPVDGSVSAEAESPSPAPMDASVSREAEPPPTAPADDEVDADTELPIDGGEGDGAGTRDAWDADPPSQRYDAETAAPAYFEAMEPHIEPRDLRYPDEAPDAEPVRYPDDELEEEPRVVRELEEMFEEWRPEVGEHVVDKPFKDRRRGPPIGVLIKGGIGTAVLLTVAFLIGEGMSAIRDARSITETGEVATAEAGPQEPGDDGATPSRDASGGFTPAQRTQVRSALARIADSRAELETHLGALDTALLAMRSAAGRADACSRADSIYQASLQDLSRIDIAREELTGLVGPMRMAGVDSLSSRAGEMAPLLKRACR